MIKKNCHSDEKTLLKYIDGEASSRRARKIEKHLNLCEPCRQAFEKIQSDSQLLKESLTYLEPPESLSLRVRPQLESIPSLTQQNSQPKWATVALGFGFGISLALIATLFILNWSVEKFEKFEKKEKEESAISNMAKVKTPKIESDSQPQSHGDLRSSEVKSDTSKEEPLEPITSETSEFSETTLVDILEIYKINYEINRDLLDMLNMLKISLELLQKPQKEENSSWDEPI